MVSAPGLRFFIVCRFPGSTCVSRSPFRASHGFLILIMSDAGSYLIVWRYHGDANTSICFINASLTWGIVALCPDISDNLTVRAMRSWMSLMLDFTRSRISRWCVSASHFPIRPTAIALACDIIIESPAQAGAPSVIMKSHSGLLTASLIAMVPPSECPSIPVLTAGWRFVISATPAAISVQKSSVVAQAKSPPLSPVPRSSIRNTA